MSYEVLHTARCNISGEAPGKNLKLITLGSESVNRYNWGVMINILCILLYADN